MTAKIRKGTAGLKIISVLMAFLLWLYVVSQGQLSAVTKQNNTQVSLQYYNLPSGLIAAGPRTVSVHLWGNFKTTGQIIAYVDLNGLSQGEYNLPVKVKPVKGALFTSVNPKKVKINLQLLKSKLKKINYEVSQNPSSGFKLVEVQIEPDKCLVRGDQAAVNRVAEIVAPLQLAGIKDIGNLKSDLVARDSQGNTITGVRLVPSTVSVYVAVEQQKQTARLKVNPQFSGTVADGYQLSGYTVDPVTVSTLGDNIVMARLTQLATDKVDLTDKKGSFDQVVNVTAPPGVSVYPAQVTVSVNITAVDQTSKAGSQSQ